MLHRGSSGIEAIPQITLLMAPEGRIGWRLGQRLSSMFSDNHKWLVKTAVPRQFPLNCIFNPKLLCWEFT